MNIKHILVFLKSKKNLHKDQIQSYSIVSCTNYIKICIIGDIDPEFNVVEVTEEAKQELAKIENKIGDYICRLCKEVYKDAFGLAQHR